MPPSLPPTDDSDLTQSHQPVVRQFKADAAKVLDVFQAGPPTKHDGLIYHYTGDVGLFEILRSGNLWMTDFSKLNDPKEIDYGMEVGSDLLVAFCRGASEPRLDKFGQLFKAVANKGVSVLMRAFILSMSTAKDELSQWRAYGDNANGYCLAFNSALLDAAFNAHKGAGAGGSFLVQYDAVALQSTMNTLVRLAATAVSALAPGPTNSVDQAMQRISAHLLFSMMVIALHFKHPAYAAEQEFRYLIPAAARGPIPGMKQRARRHGLIDYFEMDWKSQHSKALVEVMSGPAVEESKARAFVGEALLLSMPSMSTVSTDASSIPYRP